MFADGKGYCGPSNYDMDKVDDLLVGKELKTSWYNPRTLTRIENKGYLMKKVLKVIDLFAGVGGFRLGLEKVQGCPIKYEVVWSNQWEPGTKEQHAFEIYKARFTGGVHSNEDIAKVDIKEIPEYDMLVGGFPCQDYSVARTLNQAAGIVGKKGVLWWQIHRIIKDGKKPRYLMLENVDRLLRSPATQRGRDFAIMLASLSDLGYAIEWRVINAADYGLPQRRRRVYMLGYHRDTPIYHALLGRVRRKDWLLSDGVMARAFNVRPEIDTWSNFELQGGLAELTQHFGKKDEKLEFFNTGLAIQREVLTIRTDPDHKGERQVLGEIIEKRTVPEEYYIPSEEIPKWRFLKGAKSVKRVSKATGHEYTYDEGSMSFPDRLDQPSRTIVTGEGGRTPSRFKHVIQVAQDRFRRLVPEELERLNGFPSGHTRLNGISPVRRAFLMGNALVVGVVERLGKELAFRISNEPK